MTLNLTHIWFLSVHKNSKNYVLNKLIIKRRHGGEHTCLITLYTHI